MHCIFIFLLSSKANFLTVGLGKWDYCNLVTDSLTQEEAPVGPGPTDCRLDRKQEVGTIVGPVVGMDVRVKSSLSN